MAEIKNRAIEHAKQFLQEIVGGSVEAVSPPEGVTCDVLLNAGSHGFLVQARQTSSASAVYMAAKDLRSVASAFNENAPNSTAIVPLLVVPYMGEVGRRICKEEGLAWLDLSGNADIRVPGLHVILTGHENRFKKRGRKTTPFAPQASRLTRQLLLGDQHQYTQKELVELTGLDQGFASRILRRLEENRLVKRQGRAYEVAHRSLLLESWREVYDFSKHRILEGHIAARSGERLLSSLSAAFHNEGLIYAATGLAGAWLLTHFASFRLATFYLSQGPPQRLLAALGFREEKRGANTWLVIPNDEGVFSGCQERDGIWCAHPVQVYLDLKFHPERSSEAAERIGEMYLKGEDHA